MLGGTWNIPFVPVLVHPVSIVIVVFIDTQMAQVRLNCELVAAGDRSPLEEYALLAGPVPAKN